MIKVNDDFKIDLRTYGRQFDVKLKANNEDINSDSLNYIKPAFHSTLFKTIMHQIEIDSNTYIPIDTKITGKIGVKLNEKKYNYIDLNTYYVKSCERQEDTNSYRILAYTKMKESMVDSNLDITDKITVRQYLIKVCQKLNWNTNNIPETFINSEKLVDPVLHMGIGYTYRDILDEIATITCSFLLFKEDEFYLVYPNETSANIDATYLDEDNITIGEQFFINSLVFSRSEESDNIYRNDEISIIKNGLHEFKISDCQILSTNDRDIYIDEMFNYLKTFNFYTFDIRSKGILFLEACDIFNLVLNNQTYKTILLNDEINLEDGLIENLYVDKPEETETEYKYADKTDKKINQTHLIVDKQNRKIQGLINQIGDRSEKLTSITADIDKINNEVKQITDLIREVNGIRSLKLEDCAKGELKELHIYGDNNTFAFQVLDNNLIFGNNVVLGKDTSTLIITNQNTTEYNLNISEVLRKTETIADEYILKDGKAKIIRRINKDGTIKEYPTEEDLGELHINLEEGDNTLEIKDFAPTISAKYVTKTDLTDTFATKVELHTNISQTSANIMAEVNKKVDDKDFGTKIEQNYENVKLAWNQISEFIQMMIIKNNASFAILDKDKKITMALDKTGQHFYDSNQNILGDMGVKQVKEFDKQGQEQKYDYITFSIPTQYGSYTKQGMAWGVETPDGKFFPVMFIKDFYMANQESGDFGGQVVLNNCDLVIGETSGITNNSVKMSAEPTGELIFTSEVNEPINLLTLYPEGHYLNPYSALKMLDKILFYKNSAGTNTFKIGDDTNYCMFTDDGKIYGNEVGSTRCEITAKDIKCFGHIYCNNGVESFSTREKKEKIRKYKKSAIKEILNTDIYYFNYKEDPKNAKRRIGTIIGDNYKCSKDIISQTGQSISDYSMISLAYKAIQEQQQQIEELQNKIKILEDKINEKN